MLIITLEHKRKPLIVDFYIFEDGKIALEGTKEILNDKKIKNIYFGGR